MKLINTYKGLHKWVTNPDPDSVILVLSAEEARDIATDLASVTYGADEQEWATPTLLRLLAKELI